MAATASAATSSSFTPHRPSLTRPRPSLGNSIINNPSDPTRAGSSYPSTARPGLPATATAKPSTSASISAVRSGTGRKSSQAQLTAGSLSAVPDGSAGYGLAETQHLGLSPSAMQPLSSPPVNRIVNGDKVGNRNLEVGDIVDVPGGMHGTVKFIGEVKGKKGVFAGVELSREWAARGKNDGDVEGYVAEEQRGRNAESGGAGLATLPRPYLARAFFSRRAKPIGAPHLRPRPTRFRKHRPIPP